MIMAILGWCLFGLIVGAIARFILPGPHPMGILMTIVLGVIGSFTGGFLGSLLEAGEPAVVQPSGWIGSVIGALLVLWAYSYFSRPKV